MRTESFYHHAYVQYIAGGKLGYFASCPSCGCEIFPDRKTYKEALKDAVKHKQSFERQ